MAWCFDNEATQASDQLLDHLEGSTAIVPILWHIEVANTLALAER
jgi:hypothetical protein